MVVVAICTIVAGSLWNQFFRYQAYGVVEGHLLKMAAPWNGHVEHVYVREGERFSQGDLLMTLESLSLRQQLLRLQDELRIAQAGLTAESARIAVVSELHQNRRQKALSEYYEAWGNLLNEKEQLSLAENRLKRVRKLGAKQISEDEVEAATFAEAGQRLRMQQLEASVKELHSRAQIGSAANDDDVRQLQPFAMRIESLQAEIARCSEMLAEGQLLAPMSGVVVKLERLAGDHAQSSDTVLTLLEEGSLQLAMYIPQAKARQVLLDQEFTVDLPPAVNSVRCRVVRIGQQYLPAPGCIKRYYRADEQLLPVYFRLLDSEVHAAELCVGAVAALPRCWSFAPNHVAHQ